MSNNAQKMAGQAVDHHARKAAGQAVDHIDQTVGIVQAGFDFVSNGQTRHQTPVPPLSDVAELEYISALLQSASMQELRQDASISSDEIALFLKSRHGIDIDPDTVRTVILEDGLTADINDDGKENSEAGRTDNNSGGIMDLVELTSALVIPNLLRMRVKAADEQAFHEAGGKAQALVASEMGLRERQCKEHDSKEPTSDGEGSSRGPKDNTQILSDVLTLMLEDCTGDDAPKPLDEKLVQDMLCGYGEIALAKDKCLVREMVAVATTNRTSAKVSTGSTLLDTDAFTEALTSDVVRAYDPGRDERHSTNFEDVWKYSSSINSCSNGNDRWDEEGGASKRVIVQEQRLMDAVRNEKLCRAMCKQKTEKNSNGIKIRDAEATFDEGSSPSPSPIVELPASPSTTATAKPSNDSTIIPRLYTAQQIDHTVDNYRWRWHFVFLWLGFISFWVAYLRGGDYLHERCNGDSTGDAVVCPLVSGIVNQLLLMSQLIIFGTPFIVVGSVGNSIEGREPLLHIIGGIMLFAAYVFCFHFLDPDAKYWINVDAQHPQIRAITLALAIIILLVQVLNVVMIFCRRRFPHRGWHKRYFRRGLVSYEAQIKRGALFKIDRMLCNAHSVHQKVHRDSQHPHKSSDKGEMGMRFLSNFGLALDHYIKLDGQMTTIGGVNWTWKKMWDKTLFTEEGIWISGRVVAGTVFQFLVVCAIPLVAIFVLPDVLREIDEKYASNTNNDPALVLGFGVTCGFLAALIVMALFLPTMVGTTLKFRRGALPSLRSENFKSYRFVQDEATLLYGGMIWGVMFSATAVSLIIGGFVYLILWEKTSRVVLGIVGNLIGVTIICLTRMVAMMVVRSSHYSAFYRKKPLGGNILTVVMECYSIGISIWFMVTRLIKLLIITALHLGRIDTPFLADGIGVLGPIVLDNWPTVSRKEILLHEAHRHPYLETLGYLYMMQLKYGNRSFATRACSAWRLLFVLTIMPWMHKYRDLARPEHFGGEEAVLQNDSAMFLYSLAISHSQSTSSCRLFKQSMISSHKQTQLETIVEDPHTGVPHTGVYSREAEEKE